MSCEEYKRMIYLYDELSEGERKIVESHRSSCHTCTLVYEHARLQKTRFKNITPSLSATEVNPFLTQRIMNAIGESKVYKPSMMDHFFVFFAYRPVQYAFMATSLFLIGFFVTEFQRTPKIVSTSYQAPSEQREKTVELNMATFYDDAKERLSRGKFYSGEATLSLYGCLSACQGVDKDDCSDCKKRYSKFKTL